MEKIFLIIAEYSFKFGVLVGAAAATAIIGISMAIASSLK